MADVPFDRAQSYRKRARLLRGLADGMVQSGGSGDILRRLAIEYDKMADALSAKEESAAASSLTAPS